MSKNNRQMYIRSQVRPINIFPIIEEEEEDYDEDEKTEDYELPSHFPILALEGFPFMVISYPTNIDKDKNLIFDRIDMIMFRNHGIYFMLPILNKEYLYPFNSALTVRDLILFIINKLEKVFKLELGFNLTYINNSKVEYKNINSETETFLKLQLVQESLPISNGEFTIIEYK